MSPQSNANSDIPASLPSRTPRSSEIAMEKLEDYSSADACMNRCLHLAKLAARTDLPVLVLGESGTGKTVIAQAIHRSSAREQAPFVSFNAAALSDTLLDSQLFGHEKGAFTGAERQVKGKFELAHGGTLFFDEIADLSLTGQAKILRAVEDGEFERLGGEGFHRADVRLITATCHPIRAFVAGQQFRRDLFYRIKGITITVPPLRDRHNDLPRMMRREIVRAAQGMNKIVAGIEEDALELLLNHPWPGNLRELKQVIQVAVALSEGDTITRDAVILDTFAFESPSESPSESTEDIVTSVRPNPVSTSATGPSTLGEIEKAHIVAVMAMHDGNKRRSAKTLGVSRSTLDRKLLRHGLE